MELLPFPDKRRKIYCRVFSPMLHDLPMMIFQHPLNESELTWCHWIFLLSKFGDHNSCWHGVIAFPKVTWSYNEMIATLQIILFYFVRNFWFSPNDNPSKNMKDVFISSKKLFSFSSYSNFFISTFLSPLLPVSYCFRA